MESGARLSVSYAMSFTWTSEGQTRVWTSVLWVENLLFYFLKVFIRETFYGVGTETHSVTSLYNPWDVPVLTPLHLVPGDDITPC